VIQPLEFLDIESRFALLHNRTGFQMEYIRPCTVIAYILHGNGSGRNVVLL
jgi:hypothetical protein